jgi:hypothetical protein
MVCYIFNFIFNLLIILFLCLSFFFFKFTFQLKICNCPLICFYFDFNLSWLFFLLLFFCLWYFCVIGFFFFDFDVLHCLIYWRLDFSVLSCIVLSIHWVGSRVWKINASWHSILYFFSIRFLANLKVTRVILSLFIYCSFLFRFSFLRKKLFFIVLS